MNTKAHHGQTAENQKEGENFKNSQRKNHTTFKGTRIRLTADFSTETRECRRKENDTFFKKIYQILFIGTQF